MPKYRKKPVVIDAFRFGHDPAEDWFDEAENVRIVCCLSEQIAYAIIKTLEGDMTANIGDYILKGIEGELYPCRADIFKKTYEKVDD